MRVTLPADNGKPLRVDAHSGPSTPAHPCTHAVGYPNNQTIVLLLPPVSSAVVTPDLPDPKLLLHVDSKPSRWVCVLTERVAFTHRDIDHLRRGDDDVYDHMHSTPWPGAWWRA